MLEKLILSETKKYIDIANKTLSIKLPYPEVEFSLRGTTAGLAYSFQNKLNFNLSIAKENKKEFLDQTVPHEVAHIVADNFFKRRCHHDASWRGIMLNVYGKAPERCHSYEVEHLKARKTKKFLYHCSCPSNVKVGLKVHSNISSGKKNYRCVRCSKTIARENFLKRLS